MGYRRHRGNLNTEHNCKRLERKIAEELWQLNLHKIIDQYICLDSDESFKKLLSIRNISIPSFENLNDLNFEDTIWLRFYPQFEVLIECPEQWYIPNLACRYHTSNIADVISNDITGYHRRRVTQTRMIKDQLNPKFWVELSLDNRAIRILDFDWSRSSLDDWHY